jgi:hypothetical protein
MGCDDDNEDNESDFESKYPRLYTFPAELMVALVTSRLG